MSLRDDIVDILADACCSVSAVVLFPDREPDLAIVAEARHSNVHILRSPEYLMDRLA